MEVIGALMLQVLTLGRAGEYDLAEVHRRLSLPTVPEPPPESRRLPTNDEISQHASITALKRIVADATLEDFEYARTATITMNNILCTPEGKHVASRYGLSDLIDVLQKTAGEEQLGLALLAPLILRVRFGINAVGVGDLFFETIRSISNELMD